MRIPRIIHQTWKHDQLPYRFQELSNTWKDFHPNWKYNLWTDDMNLEFIEKYFPEFTSIYNSYDTNIQRVDAVRYLILYREGGVFIDLDFECRQNFESLLLNRTFLLGKEPKEHCDIHNKEMIISNAFMASIPGHNFLKSVYEELRKPQKSIEHPNDRILETTGPFMLTRVYESNGANKDVCILDSNMIYPLSKSEISKMSKGRKNNQIFENKLKQAYAIHYYYGTWWDKNSIIK